jgi:hypothetical protein
MGLVNSPECGICKQVPEMASHFLCNWDALVTLSFRHLGQCFVKSGDSEDISGNGAANFLNIRAAQKIIYGRSAWVTALPALLFYSFVFCSVLFCYIVCHVKLSIYVM